MNGEDIFIAKLDAISQSNESIRNERAKLGRLDFKNKCSAESNTFSAFSGYFSKSGQLISNAYAIHVHKSGSGRHTLLINNVIAAKSVLIIMFCRNFVLSKLQ